MSVQKTSELILQPATEIIYNAMKFSFSASRQILELCIEDKHYEINLDEVINHYFTDTFNNSITI